MEAGTIRRNRQEKRVVEVFRASRILDLPEWQTHAVAAVRVTRTVLHKDVAAGWKWRPTREVAWYASTREGNSAADYAAATRGHWHVESVPPSTRKGVHHELTPCEQAAWKMRVGPSGSAFRGGSQTTPGGGGQEPWS